MKIEKYIWTDGDFEQMGWQDNKIHAILFGIDKEHKLMFDIDYLLKWIEPQENETCFNFLVAPATLVFRNVYDI